jgi:dTDP-4-amino-4,6-dideoxygalactose transaminase
MRLKNSPQDLAVAGGRPAFESPLHVGRPNLCDRERLAGLITGILDRRWLTNRGPVVRELEAAIERHVGVRHCVAVCNATIGLEVAIKALDLEGEVIVPSFTFVATAHALKWLGIEPVFCDVDPTTHNLDPASVEALITPRTSAIVGVHLWGRPCAIDPLSRIASRFGLHLLFDAAHAFSCADGAVMIGNFGDLEVFSFHATKFLNSFEGGAIVTNSDALAERLRLMINFGFAGFDNVISLGTNAKMHEVSAAMGLASLERVDELVEVNRAHYECYVRGLHGIPGVRLVPYPPENRSNYQYVVLEIDELRTGLTRDEIARALTAEGVIARRYFYPGCHRMQPYRSEQPDRVLPHTEALCERVLTLPTGTAVTEDDVQTVAGILGRAVEWSPHVRAALLPASTAAAPR